MKRLAGHVAICLASFLAGALLAQEPPVTKAQKLTPEQLKSLIDSKEKFLFLDVREPKELEELGTLPGYVNIPLGQLEKRIAEVPKDVYIVSACNRARRAATAAGILEKHGVSKISLFAMTEWTEKGWDVIHPKAPQTGEEKK